MYNKNFLQSKKRSYDADATDFHDKEILKVESIYYLSIYLLV